MNVVDIMTANPITIRVDRHLRDALELLEANQIKHLPVLSVRQHLIGIVSDRDCRSAMNSPFIERTYWQNNIINEITVRQIMTPAPIAIEPDASATEAARLMLTHRIGCLPVMRGETLIGIITRSDMLVACMTLHRHYERLIDQEATNALHVPKL